MLIHSRGNQYNDDPRARESNHLDANDVAPICPIISLYSRESIHVNRTLPRFVQWCQSMIAGINTSRQCDCSVGEIDSKTSNLSNHVARTARIARQFQGVVFVDLSARPWVTRKSISRYWPFDWFPEKQQETTFAAFLLRWYGNDYLSWADIFDKFPDPRRSPKEPRDTEFSSRCENACKGKVPSVPVA